MDQSVSSSRVSCLIVFITMFYSFIEISVFTADSLDPDQMPDSAAFDLSLHCLLIILFGASRLKLVQRSDKISSAVF